VNDRLPFTVHSLCQTFASRLFKGDASASPARVASRVNRFSTLKHNGPHVVADSPRRAVPDWHCDVLEPEPVPPFPDWRLKMTSKNLPEKQRVYFENVCNGLQRSLPKDDVASLVLDRACVLLEQNYGRDAAAERLRERVIIKKRRSVIDPTAASLRVYGVKFSSRMR
jgi:hypothetical protein